MLAALLTIQTAAASVLVGALPASGDPAHSSRPAGASAPSRTLRAVSLGGTRTDALLDRVRAGFSDAVGSVERFWGTDWPTEIVVVATGSPAQFAAEAKLDPGGRWTDIAAVAVADAVDADRRQATGQRIILAPEASGMSDIALRIVLAHELFHLAARVDTALDAPRWLTEGVADLVARPPAPQPAGAAGAIALPTDAELDQTGPVRSTGYDRAWWFARFVVDSYGPEKLRRLYDLACGPGHGDLAWAVREALDVDLIELQDRWADWLNR